MEGTPTGAVVGTPSVGGIGDSMKDYGVGALGGIGFNIISSIIGSGFLGSLIATGLVGSMVKGTRGTVLATTLGFQGMTQGAAQPAAAQNQTPERGVM